MVARAVFLDRDGVLNESIERNGRPVAPTRIEDFRLLPGVEDGVQRLKAADGCACRKPKPGMLLAAAAEHGLALAHSYLVGDRGRDVDAGRAAGCSTILVASRGTETAEDCRPDFVAGSLPEAVDLILRQEVRTPL